MFPGWLLCAAFPSHGEVPSALSLDRELARLDAIRAAGQPIEFGANLKVGLIQTRGDLYELSNDERLGAEVLTAEPQLRAKIGNTTMEIVVEFFTDGTSQLQDAWAEFPLPAWFEADLTVRLGRFKPPVLSSGLISTWRTLFLSRGVNEAIWKERDQGAQLTWRHESMTLDAAAFNGGDGLSDEYLTCLRGNYDAFGPGFPRQAGGFGPEAPDRLSFAAALVNEGELDDADVLVYELLATRGAFFFQAEKLEYGDGWTAGAITQGAAAGASGFRRRDPWSASLAVAPHAQWEFAGRWESLDDGEDTRVVTLGLNHYLGGHALKWQADWSYRLSDDVTLEGERIELGLVFHF